MFAKAKLYELIPGGMNRLWQPDGSTNVIGTSADGMIAAGSQPGGPRDVRLFRRNGRQVESLGTFKAGVTPSRLRPSHHGSWVAVLARLTEVGLEIFDRQGSKVALDTGDMKRSSDLVWLDDCHAVGLLTHHAARGDLCAQESVVLWDASTGRVLKTATHPTAMDVLAAAPDGRRFAEAGADKIVRIRDGQTLEVRTQFRAHNAPITALAWHPTLPLLATGSDDLSIKVWNLETGRLLVTFDDLLNRPDSLAFSPSGRYLAARTSQDYIGRVWTFDDWLAPEPQLATSPLSLRQTDVHAATQRTGP